MVYINIYGDTELIYHVKVFLQLLFHVEFAKIHSVNFVELRKIETSENNFFKIYFYINFALESTFIFSVDYNCEKNIY